MDKVVTIRNAGQINFNSQFKDGKNTRKIRDFLEKTAVGFVRKTIKYLELISNDIPFAYRERQLHSILAPVFNDLAKGCFKMEVFVSRHKKLDRNSDDRHGWVDYWCGYRNTDIFIELKHGYISARSGEVRGSNQEKWTEAFEQIQSIKRDIKDYSIIGKKNSVCLSMMVIPIYETISSSGESKYAGDIKKMIELQQENIDKLKPCPNWSALWIPHSNLDMTMEFVDTTEYYPGLLFFVFVSS